MAFIYKITNKTNGKIYIGKTEETVEKRFKQHLSESNRNRCKDRPLYKAIKKYGKENFEVSLVEETQDADIREIFWINFYNSYSNGYNATKGGDGKSYVNKDLILDVLLNTTKNCAEVARLTGYDRATCVKVAKENKLYEKHSGLNNNLMKSVIGTNLLDGTTMVFNSCREASRYFISLNNLNSKSESGYAGHIASCCNGKRKSAFGFRWIYCGNSGDRQVS